MRYLFAFTILLLCLSVSAQQNHSSAMLSKSAAVKIKWRASVKGNFSFRKNWDYPEGIFKNEFGQLSCNGFCEQRAANMIDSNGRISEDSLKPFYEMVDTSHLYHSIASDAWCYEWAGTDFINVKRVSSDSVIGETELNAATHCSLQLVLVKDSCEAIIKLTSIFKGSNAVYYCVGGDIEADSTLWKRGILKAIFKFNFYHTDNPGKPMFWNGKIYAPIIVMQKGRNENVD